MSRRRKRDAPITFAGTVHGLAHLGKTEMTLTDIYRHEAAHWKGYARGLRWRAAELASLGGYAAAYYLLSRATAALEAVADVERRGRSLSTHLGRPARATKRRAA